MMGVKMVSRYCRLGFAAPLLLALLVGCTDSGGKIISPKDTKQAPPPPLSPAGGAPKLPKQEPQ